MIVKITLVPNLEDVSTEFPNLQMREASQRELARRQFRRQATGGTVVSHLVYVRPIL